MAKSMEKITKGKDQNTVKATATMPVSVTLYGNVKEPNDVTDRRNGLSNPNPPLPPFSKGGRGGLLLNALCCLLIFWGGCASLSQKDMVLALVDGDPITEGDLKYSLTVAHRKEDLSSAGSLDISRYVNKLIDDRLFVHEARTDGMDQLPEIKQAIEAYLLRESVVRLHKEEIVDKVSITEDEMRDYYRKNYEQFKLGIIEVKSEGEAGEILSRLKNGADFAELVQKFSTHPSKEKQGEIALKRMGMASEVYNAVSALNIGEYSKSRGG